MRHFVGVGACYLDTILWSVLIMNTTCALLTMVRSVSHYPSEDEKLRALSTSTRRGGNCPNTLEVLRDLLQSVDAPTTLHLVAVLPSRQSSATGKIEESLGSGVSLQACLFREEYHNPPSSYIIRSLATDSRTIINYNDLPEMSYDEFSRAADALSAEDTWYHFEVPMILES